MKQQLRNYIKNLHPGASFEKRRECLRNLKEIGYQIGAGIYGGST